MKTTVNKSFTLIEFLFEQYPDSPRTRIKKILQSGVIRINDKQVTKHSYLLKPGDIVEINQHEVKAARVALPFPVLYEDEQVIVVDKPAGISTSSIDGSANILDVISAFLIKLTKGRVRAHVVHRLDKEVSGVVLFAKSRELMDIIKEKWEETEKHYYALVEGTPARPGDTIKSWLIEDGQQKVHSTRETANAKFSVTSYKTIKQVDKYTLLDVSTETGRKNQIRVHLSDIGCPIVGDYKYGAARDFKRQIRLHAFSLSFPHPLTGKMITVQSSMPGNFLKIKPKDEDYK